MEHPVKTAPCPLYFRAQGGQFDRLGNPIVGRAAIARYEIEALSSSESGAAALAPLLCDRAYDCGVCPLLHEWVAGEMTQGWSVDWDCWVCLKHNTAGKDGPEVEKRCTGFYQSGRPADEDDDHPPLTGCTSCGQPRSILQLVLRRPRPGG